MKTLNLENNKFGRLLVIKSSSLYNVTAWECLCTCGNNTIVRTSDLRNGHTKSCGCLAKEVATKHGATKDKKRLKLYRVWVSMRARCSNKKLKTYKHYGGRGIKVVGYWNEFETFEKWALKNGYKVGLTIDRIDNNGGYEPNNCRWVSQKENSINRRTTKFVTYKNKTLSLSDWSRELFCERGYLTKMKYKTNKTYEELISQKLYANSKSNGFSVRCIKDNNIII